jgi:serine/threonine-protein kinase
MPFQQGENVGPYRIIEQLGQGGMATVFKAYHPNLDRYVAIKVLHPAFKQDPQFLERFQREARVVAKLDHPNIVPVFDYADHDGQSYLVMKFIEGETLKGVIDRQWPSKEQILGIVRSVGNALTYAHGKGVLHRDVKPSNILLAEPGSVYLADFGLARMAEAGESTLSSDQLLGTPHYISPEQARGEKDLDAGTDIYSLGIVLYQLAVGRVPYNSDTPFSIIHDHIYTPLPMPRSINEKIPEDLERVLLKALAKDRKDRFASVQELVDAFDNAARGISPWDEQGVGAVVPVAAAVAEVSERVAAPVSEPIAAAASGLIAEPSTTTAAEDPVVGPLQTTAADPVAEPVAASKANPKPRRWAWVGGGLAFSLLSLVTFGFVMGGAAGERVDPGGQQPAFNQPPQDQYGGPTISSEDQPTLFDRPMQGAIPSASQWVNEDPYNPDAHFKLAQALATEGDLEPATSEFTRASELYIGQANYVGAAESLVNSLEISGANPADDLKVSNLLSQALFLGAESGEMFPAIDVLYEISPEWEPLEALDARSLLYIGQTEAAAGIVDRLILTYPESILANAVMIDILHQEGNDQQALDLTNRLLQRPRTPPWLDEHLQGYQATLSS